jgi:hypothetical protein
MKTVPASEELMYVLERTNYKKIELVDCELTSFGSQKILEAVKKNVTSLFLKNSVIDFKTTEFIFNELRQLKEIRFSNTVFQITYQRSKLRKDSEHLTSIMSTLGTSPIRKSWSSSSQI